MKQPILLMAIATVACVSAAFAVTPATAPTVPTQDTTPTITVSIGQSIQSAIDQAAAAGGGTVQLNSGTYLISTALVLKSNVTLQGVASTGSGLTTISNGIGTNMVCMIDNRAGGLNNAILKNVKIDGALERSNRNYTSDIGKNYGVMILDDSGTANNNVLVDNVQITRCAVGLHVKGTTNLTIRNSNVHDNGGWPKYFHNVYLRRVSKVNVQGCTLNDSYGGNGLNLSYSDNVTVQSTQANNNGFRGLRAAEDTNVDILGCTASGNADYGIVINSEANGVHSFRLHNNTANSNNIGVATSSNSSDGEVWYNTATGNTTANFQIQSSSTSVK
jgi:polygalacturonase